MSARKLFTSVKQLPGTLFFTMITLYLSILPLWISQLKTRNEV